MRISIFFFSLVLLVIVGLGGCACASKDDRVGAGLSGTAVSTSESVVLVTPVVMPEAMPDAPAVVPIMSETVIIALSATILENADTIIPIDDSASDTPDASASSVDAILLSPSNPGTSGN